MPSPRLVSLLAIGLVGMLSPSDAWAGPDARVYVTPTFNVSYAVFHPVSADRWHSSLHLWNGIALHPHVTDHLSPFVALGVETEVLWSDGGTRVQHTPMSRVGLTLPLDSASWLEIMLPALSVYAMAGARPPLESAPAAARMGLGVNSFWLPLFALSETATLIPGSYEGLVELLGDGEHRFMLRFGMGF